MREKLVEFVLTDRSSRFMPLWEIPVHLDWDVSEDLIRAALDKEGLHRRHARIKPFLSEAHRQARLEWCRERLGWTVEQWRSVLWTDETAMQVLGQARGYVTRRPGEEFLLDCIMPKFKKLSACMFWGSISGLKGKGKVIYFSLCSS
jgi:hypothetical protein